MFEPFVSRWKSEPTRHVLWLPVLFGAGIALYFSLKVEPPEWLLPLLVLMAIGGAVALRKRALPLMLAVLIVLAGAGYTQWRTLAHQPMMLREALSPRLIVGEVRDIERTQAGVRLRLKHLTVDGLAPELTPAEARLSVRFKQGAAFELPRIGDAIGMRAGLMPPMGPALPGGFDFARYFYFSDIGAVGYGLPPWKVLGEQKTGEGGSLADDFWSWRSRLTDRIVREVGIETGGIAAGLITGDARAISQSDFEALRASNLYHIIAISGEHMVMISGVIFIGLRLLMLLLPPRYRYRPESKSVAALLALVLVTVYLFVTGLPTSAVRAYVMIALVLLAILSNRQVDAMRSLAITALLMLVYDPAALLDPGFQLSFAATLALIALIESPLLAQAPGVERSRRAMAGRYVLTMLLTSVVAEAATTPFVISLFNNVSPYGVLANSIATPLVSLFLMPLVAVFFLLLPFGAEGLALALMQYGIEGLLAIGRWVASFPYAQIFAPSLPAYGLALFTMGLLWICLWRTRWRRWGLVPALLGVATLATVTSPDMLIGSTLKQIAFRGSDGFVLARGRADSMVPELWANGMGEKRFEKAEAPDWRCDAMGCVARVHGARVAFPQDLTALPEDCAQAKLVVTLAPNAACNGGAEMLNERTLKQTSAAALWLNPGQKPRLETSRDWQGQRPWSLATEEDEGEEP